LKNLKTNEVRKVDVDAKTGEYVYTQVLEDDQMLTVEKKGYFYNSQMISKDDTTFESPKKLDFELGKLEKGSSFVVDNILFATDSYVLTSRAKLELDNLAKFLKSNTTVKIAIEGHTDSVGDDSSNKELSKNRAKAVFDYIVQKGTPALRLGFEGYGEDKPIASNDSEEGRARNRRTEVKILEI